MNAATPGTVDLELTVELVVTPSDAVPLIAVLHYDASDPYAVHVTFVADPEGEGVCWVFARELLAQGLHRPTGAGDVRVRPQLSEGRQVVFIELSSPDGEALIKVGMADVRHFLGRTFAVCAPGEESDHLELDRAIALLLAC